MIYNFKWIRIIMFIYVYNIGVIFVYLLFLYLKIDFYDFLMKV